MTQIESEQGFEQFRQTCGKLLQNFWFCAYYSANLGLFNKLQVILIKDT